MDSLRGKTDVWREQVATFSQSLLDAFGAEAFPVAIRQAEAADEATRVIWLHIAEAVRRPRDS